MQQESVGSKVLEVFTGISVKVNCDNESLTKTDSNRALLQKIGFWRNVQQEVFANLASHEHHQHWNAVARVRDLKKCRRRERLSEGERKHVKGEPELAESL